MTIYSVQSPKFQQFLVKKRVVTERTEDAGMGGFKMPDVDSLEPPGMCPLAAAAWRGEVSQCRKLIDQKADIEARDEAGRTVLALAAAAARPKVVKLLLGQKASVEAADRAGLTPLHWAAKEGCKGEVKMLLDADANLQAQDEDGMTALKLAALFNQIEVVRELVTRGAEPGPALELVQRFSRCAPTAQYLKEALAAESQ